jgi:glycosyltransferase involved in cell wall biosynthesis
LEPENNALGVIEAYNAVVAQKPDCMPLVIVGDAPYATEYKARLREVACSKVIFTGFQFGDAYEEFQSNCYLYVQATEVGGTHPALIESMSYGNCVIANGTPENIEVIDGAALSFPKNDFAELARIMSSLLRDPERVAQIGREARERSLAQFSWDAIVSQYEGLLNQLLERHRASDYARQSKA